MYLMEALISARRAFRLDFDDAYQYIAAGNRGAVIVTFDADFDRTERGRKSPSGVLEAK